MAQDDRAALIAHEDRMMRRLRFLVDLTFATIAQDNSLTLDEAWDHVRALKGAAFGTAVWGGADEIAVPMLGLSKPNAEYPLEAHAQAFAAHIVYGVTTELVRRAVRPLMSRERGPERPVLQH